MIRRKIAKAHMAPSEFPVTLTTFPRLGCKDCIKPSYPVSGCKLRSQFVPDEIANPHIRFPTLAANIRARRGRKVQVNVPVFKDKNTPWPWKDPTVNYDLHKWPEDDDVRMERRQTTSFIWTLWPSVWAVAACRLRFKPRISLKADGCTTS